MSFLEKFCSDLDCSSIYAQRKNFRGIHAISIFCFRVYLQFHIFLGIYKHLPQQFEPLLTISGSSPVSLYCTSIIASGWYIQTTKLLLRSWLFISCQRRAAVLKTKTASYQLVHFFLKLNIQEGMVPIDNIRVANRFITFRSFHF